LGLGGLQAELSDSGPQKVLDRPTGEDIPVSDWQTLTGDGSVRSLRLDVGQVNQAFIDTGDERAIKRPEKGNDGDTFVEMHMALVSVPEIGRTLMGDQEYENLVNWLGEGEEAILVLGRGKYSFKGSGYVRGGIFDRIQLIQGDSATRFFDKQHLRLGRLATTDSPTFSELDLFKIPAEMEFDPAMPLRLQLLVQRSVGAIEKAFITFDLGYRVPDRYLKTIATGGTVPAEPQIQGELSASNPDELSHLWKRIAYDIAVLDCRHNRQILTQRTKAVRARHQTGHINLVEEFIDKGGTGRSMQADKAKRYCQKQCSGQPQARFFVNTHMIATTR
jgi:NosR/NirI family nitrous oxide reductase transcriptional regulator